MDVLRRLRRRDLAGLVGGAALLAAGGWTWAGSGQTLAADVGSLTAVPAPAATRVPAATPALPPDPAPPPSPAPARPKAQGAAGPVAVPTRLTVPSAAFTPRRLELPAIGVDSEVVPVDAPDGVLDVPEDPAVLGWWKAGARPGAGVGSVVLDGHVDSREFGRGPLKRAVELRPGDTAVLSGPGTDRSGRRAYDVVAVRTFEKERLPAGELFTRRGPERLVLVTCGGEYRRSRGGWDSNVVVVLEPRTHR